MKAAMNKVNETTLTRVVSFTLFIAAFMLLFVHYKAAWIKERTLDRQKTHEL